MQHEAHNSLEALLQHQGRVRALARSLVRDAATADDLVQEALLAACRRPEVVSKDAVGLVARMLRNRARDRARSEGRRAQRERDVARTESTPDVAQVVVAAERQRALMDAVLALDEPYRGAVLLRWFEELPPRAIARRTGCSVAAVKKRLQRGLDQLRVRLEARFGRDGAWAVALLPVTGDSVLRGGGALVLASTLRRATVGVALLGGAVVGADALWPMLLHGEGDAVLPQRHLTRATNAGGESIGPGAEPSSLDAPRVAAVDSARAAREARSSESLAASNNGSVTDGPEPPLREPSGATQKPDRDIERGVVRIPAASERTAETLRGSVVDRVGRAVEGARIELAWLRAVSDLRGEFALPLDPLMERSYTLRFLREDPYFVLDSIDVPAGTRDLVVRVAADHFRPRLTGRAIDRAGRPLPGLELSLAAYECAPGVARTMLYSPRMLTDEKGHFELQDVPRGEVALAFHPLGGAWYDTPTYVPLEASGRTSVAGAVGDVVVDIYCEVSARLTEGFIGASLRFIDSSGAILAISEVDIQTKTTGLRAQQSDDGSFGRLFVPQHAVAVEVLDRDARVVRRAALELSSRERNDLEL